MIPSSLLNSGVNTHTLTHTYTPIGAALYRHAPSHTPFDTHSHTHIHTHTSGSEIKVCNALPKAPFWRDSQLLQCMLQRVLQRATEVCNFSTIKFTQDPHTIAHTLFLSHTHKRPLGQRRQHTLTPSLSHTNTPIWASAKRHTLSHTLTLSRTHTHRGSSMKVRYALPGAP